MANQINQKEEDVQAKLLLRLRGAVGSLCEVRSIDNQLIFLGHVRAFNGEAITIADADGKAVPQVIYNSPCKIVVRVPGSQTMVWHGLVCGSNNSIWKIDRLGRYNHAENRSYFRQPISMDAEVLCVNAIYPGSRAGGGESQTLPCRVLDISLEGAQIRVQARFERGDKLLLSNLFLLEGDERPFLLTGQVCWADRAGKGAFLFGCRFETLTVQEQDRLCSAIFELQRRALKKQRRR